MKDRPIMFAAESVRHVLAGTKTETRRLIEPQPTAVWGYGRPLEHIDPQRRFGIHAAFDEDGRRVDRWLPCRYGAAGDRLWVREAWRTWDVGCQGHDDEDEGCDEHCHQTYVAYAATPRTGYRPLPDAVPITYLDESTPLDRNPQLLGPWRSGRFMPRWASRLVLEVLEIRAERLQELTEEGARAEGCSSVEQFAARWNEINRGRISWAASPWVWVVRFPAVAS